MRSGNVFIVHNSDHLDATLTIAAELAMPIQLQTPASALTYMGPAMLKEMLDQAVERHPNAQFNIVCDAGEDPAHVQEAFQAGFKMVRFTGDALLKEKLESIANHYHGVLCCEDDEDLEVLDLCFVVDVMDACKRWCLQESAAAA